MEETQVQDEVPEILRTTARGRIYLAGLFVLVFALIAAFQFLVFPLLTGAARTGLAANAFFTRKIIFLCFVATVMAAAIFVIFYGRKIVRHRQFPLPGAWVWRDTPIKRGQSAIKLAWLHFLTGGIICVMCLALTAYLWKDLDRPAPKHKSARIVSIIR